MQVITPGYWPAIQTMIEGLTRRSHNELNNCKNAEEKSFKRSQVRKFALPTDFRRLFANFTILGGENYYLSEVTLKVFWKFFSRSIKYAEIILLTLAEKDVQSAVRTLQRNSFFRRL